MKGSTRPRSILHVDLDPFVVSVERSLDPALRGRPVVVGGDAGSQGFVAAASDEARAAGVRPGLALAQARRVCPDAVFRPGDLETYARVSEEVTAILLAASHRVERPSADEAYLDVTPDTGTAPGAVAAAESIKDQIQRRLGLDASLGLASTRLAARVASRFARPRGLLVVLPGYEASFLGRQDISALPDLPPHLEAALRRAEWATLAQVAEADDAALAALVGSVAAARLKATVRAEDDAPIAVAAPPASVQEETVIRARGSDRVALEAVLDGLSARAWRRLRPFELAAGALAVEVRRAEGTARRSDLFPTGLRSEEALLAAVRGLAEGLLDPPASVRALQLRLTRLSQPAPQPPLFPEEPQLPLLRPASR